MSTTVMRTRSTIREEKESLKIFESQDKDIDALENHMKKLEPAKTSRRLSSYSTGLLAENVKDIDAAHEKSTILMSIYVKDIYAYLHELEMKYRIRPKHLEGHVNSYI